MAEQKSWVVGSAADCDLVVDHPAVSANHCRLTKINGRFILEDLNSANGTYLNGNTVSGRTPVSRSDEIVLGANVPMPWPDQARPDTGACVATQSETTTSETVVINIGRDSDNDVVLDYPIVSGHHARIVIVSDRMTLVDLQSANGTAIGSAHNRITRVPITANDVLYFGSLRVPAARLLDRNKQVGTQSQGEFEFRGDEVIFGRHASCDQVLNYPMVSQRHARLYRSGQSLTIEDLGSANGTYVNDERITGPVRLQLGDVIGLGSYTFTLTSGSHFEKRDYRGNVSIEARDIIVEVPGKRLVENVSLTIFPSEFVGLMGPSGAGKTTLMSALNGYAPPARGKVLLNGQDLYANYAFFAPHLGYVPQDDIIHGDLTVGQSLYFTAKLRLPPDTSESEIYERVRSVLDALGLAGTENVLIGSPEKKGISGGQRKRVNLAMELLTDPSVLYLDEPTSGLSSEDALMVMKLLRKLADSGKAILLTIHQPSLEAYRLLDNLVLMGKDSSSTEPGVLVYYGPAYPDAVTFFNPKTASEFESGAEPSPDEVLRGLASQPTATWAASYQASRYQTEFVTDRAGKGTALSEKAVVTHRSRDFGLIQWLTLVRRCAKIKSRDLWNTLILLAQAPFIGILVVLVLGDDASQNVTAESWPSVANAVSTTIFLIGLSALWFGCSNSVREIVGEWAIYKRERMVNLKIPSYVCSKLAVLGVLCIIQCATLIGIIYWGCGLQGSLLMLFGTLLLISSVGIAIGLVVSSLARTSEVAVSLLPIILLPMVILGGAFQPTHKMNDLMRLASNLAPSRWAFESMLLVESRERPRATPSVDDKGGAQQLPASDGNENDSANKPTSQPDMAEHSFPKDERFGTSTGNTVLAGMFVLLVSTIHLILRRRDIH